MRLLPSLLRRLYRALNPDPNAYVAMRAAHPAGGTIEVAGATLIAQAGGIPAPAPRTLELGPSIIADPSLDGLAPATTNGLRNPRGLGLVPGIATTSTTQSTAGLPLFWSRPNPGGLTTESLAILTRYGQPSGGRFRIYGTASGSLWTIEFELRHSDAPNIVGPSTPYAIGVTLRLAGGSFVGVPALTLRGVNMNAGSTIFTSQSVAIPFPTAEPQRFSVGAVSTNDPAMAKVIPGLVFTAPAGASIDVTLDIEWPQIEARGSATSPSLPLPGTTGASTRLGLAPTLDSPAPAGSRSLVLGGFRARLADHLQPGDELRVGDPASPTTLRIASSDQTDLAGFCVATLEDPLAEPLAAGVALYRRRARPIPTLREAADWLTAGGWAITDLDTERRERSAFSLLERPPSGEAALTAHDSLLWSLMDAYAVELDLAAQATASAPEQLAASTADGFWLDELGRYYGTARLPLEPDAQYAERMVAEVLRPKSNNLAMAASITAITGQPATVRDVTEYGPVTPAYNGAITHNGAYTHNAVAKPIFGLFDVETAFDLLSGGDIAAFQAAIIAQVDRLRAAGTLMRQLTVVGGNIAEPASGPQPDPASTAGMGLASGPAFATAAADPEDTSLAAAGGAALSTTAADPDDTSLPATAAAALASAASNPAAATLANAGTLSALASAAAEPNDTATIPLAAGPTFTNAAPAPAQTMAASGTLADLTSAGADPDDTAAIPIAAGAALANAASPPDDTAAIPMAAGPTFSNAAQDPADTALANTTDAVLASSAPTPDDTSLPAAAAAALASAAAEPAQTMVATAGPSFVTAAPEPGEVTALSEAYTHALDGAWTLNGRRPLASGAPVSGPI